MKKRQALPHSGESIMVSKWPEYSEDLAFETEEENFQIIMDAIRAIRNRRNEMNVPPSKKAKVVIVSDRAELFESCVSFIERLAYASEALCDDNYNPDGAVTIVTNAATIYIPMKELMDFSKELAKANEDKEFFEKKLNNPGFVAKAPEKVVFAQKEQLAKVLEKIENLLAGIEDIKKQM